MIICSSCFSFLFVENNHLFVLLKYLFPVAEINYLVLKNYLSKKMCKDRQVCSCFEDPVIKKIMAQSEFNLDAQFNDL